MRIYSSAYEVMSELGRNLWEMGCEVKPKTYQNKVIEGNDDFVTKELISEQYCLTRLPDPQVLFIHDPRSMKWTEEEFYERVKMPVKEVNKVGYVNPGTAYLRRPDLWEQFLREKGGLFGEKPYLGFDYTYNERMMFLPFISAKGGYGTPNLIKVIELLKSDNDTRKAILPIFSVADVSKNDGRERIPCSMYYNFLIREINGNKQLNILYHQRSADLVTHFGNDIWLAWKLMEYVAGQVGVKPGYLYHTIDSLHSYKKDWDKLKTSITEMKSK